MAEQSFFDAFDAAPEETATQPEAGASFAKAFESGTEAKEPSVITTMQAPLTGAYEGAAEILGAPVDVTAWALRKAGLPTGKMPLGGSESFKALGRKYMETVGAKVPEPASEAERLLHSFGKGVAGAVVPAVGAETMLPKIAGMYPNAASTLETLFAPRAAGVAPMAELATLGGTSGVGAEVGMEMAPDRWKPLVGLAGGIAGGGVGALATSGARTLPTLAQRGMQYLEPLTEGGIEKAAARRLGDNMTSPLAALEAIETKPHEIVAGSKPTTFELTGDMGLGQAQRKAETTVPAKFLERKAEQAAARSAELGKVSPDGEITDLPTYLRARSEELDRNAANYVRQAEVEARREVEKLGGSSTAEEYGSILRDKLETAKSKMKQEREELYGEVDPSGTLTVDASPISASAVALTKRGPLSAPLSAAEEDIFAKAKSLGPDASFNDLREFDTYVTAEMAAERRARGETPTWGRLAALKSKVMDVLASSSDNDALAAAKAKHAEYKQTFGRGPVGEALKTEGFSRQYRTPDATSVAKFFPAGDKGFEAATAFRKAIGSDAEAADAMHDYVVWSLKKEAMTPEGVIDPAKFASWRNRHESALRAFPELAGKFDTAVSASERVGLAAEATKKVVGEQQTKAVQSLMNLSSPEDVKKTVGALFGQKNVVTQIADLAAKAKENPDAFNGLRRAVAEHIRDRFISNAEAGTSGANLIKSDSFQTFLKNNAAALGKVFSPEEMTSLRNIAADLHRSNRSIRSTALPGRSTSAQDILPTIKDKKLDLKSLLDVVVGGGGVALMGSHPVLGTLSVASAAGHHILEGLRHEGLQSVNDLVVEAILNPDVAKKLLRKIPVESGAAPGSIKDDLRRVPAYGLIQGQRGQPDRGSYATGGGIKMTSNKLLAMAERSKKKIQSHSKPILEQPDEHVVHALKVANGSINNG